MLVVFIVSLPAMNFRLYASDEVQYFAFLRSLWFDRDLSFDNEYRTLYESGVAKFDGFRETYLERTTETGLRINFGTIGPAVLWAPFYAVADVGVVVARTLGSDVERSGYSAPYIAAVCFASALYGFIGLVLSARLARVMTGTGDAAAVAVWLGTPLLFYMYLAAGMAHAVSAFAVSAMLTTWVHVRQRWQPGGVATLGLMAGLIAVVREQDAILLVAPLLDYGLALRRRARSLDFSVFGEMKRAAAGLCAFAVVYAPQIFAYLILNARPGPSPLVTRKMTWWSPHGFEVLFSTAHGLFAWTPLALLSLLGLCLLLRRRANLPATLAVDDVRTISLCLCIALFGQVYISGSVESWTVAGAFGQRRFVAITPLLVIGLAALWQTARSPKLRVGLGVLIAATIWWNLGLMALFGTRMMDRQRLELARNAYDVFITLPRMAPELAWRYVTRRESFYNAPAPPQ